MVASYGLLLYALRDRFVITPELKKELHAATGLRFSNSAIRRRLRGARLKASRPSRGVIMSRVYIRPRGYKTSVQSQTQNEAR